MKILVTGAAGFIGFHLSKSLLEDGHELLGIDNINDYYDKSLKFSRLAILEDFSNFTFIKLDISNIDDLAKIFKKFGPQKVVNLAAQAGVRYSLENPFAYLNSNLAGFINIIELCRQNDVEGLIYASSSSVYGGNKKTPFSILDRADIPYSLYGATKRSNELIAYSYSHLYKLNTIGLRYFTVYGPWYRPDMAMFIFTKKIISGEPIPVFNNGNLSRDFTYIDDIINGTRSAIDKKYNFELFNLGNNKSENIVDMISLIEKELNIKATIDYKPMQPGDVYHTCADIEYSKERLGYSPKTTINTGIPKFVKWYKEFYNV